MPACAWFMARSPEKTPQLESKRYIRRRTPPPLPAHVHTGLRPMRRGPSVRQGSSSRVWGADFSPGLSCRGRRSFLSASKGGRMWYPSMRFGGMAEWLKALVLKTSRVKALVGSNPTSSARLFYPVSIARGGVLFCVKVRLLSIYRRGPVRPSEALLWRNRGVERMPLRRTAQGA